MALMPKRVKYRKEFRRTRPRNATKGNYVAFGDYGLQALEGTWLKGTCIEAGRIAAQHYLKRRGQAVDPGVPGQADLEEAAGNANGDW